MSKHMNFQAKSNIHCLRYAECPELSEFTLLQDGRLLVVSGDFTAKDTKDYLHLVPVV